MLGFTVGSRGPADGRMDDEIFIEFGNGTITRIPRNTQITNIHLD